MRTVKGRKDNKLSVSAMSRLSNSSCFRSRSSWTILRTRITQASMWPCNLMLWKQKASKSARCQVAWKRRLHSYMHTSSSSFKISPKIPHNAAVAKQCRETKSLFAAKDLPPWEAHPLVKYNTKALKKLVHNNHKTTPSTTTGWLDSVNRGWITNRLFKTNVI